MAKVFLHTKDNSILDWKNGFREFARVPVVGELVATSSDSPLHEVQLVIHTPFKCDYEADVYAIAANNGHSKHLSELLTGNGFVW